MTEDIIAIIEKQDGEPDTKEFKEVFNYVCIKSCDTARSGLEFAVCCCWYAMQYGRIKGIRAERRKKKKAAQRCSTERQEATKHTKV